MALSCSLSFTTPKPPSIPVLKSPTHYQLLTTYTPTLSWAASTVPVGAPAFASYHLQLSAIYDFSTTLFDQPSLTTTSFSVPSSAPLANNQKFYWRVQACNINGDCSSWAKFSFYTALPPPA